MNIISILHIIILYYTNLSMINITKGKSVFTMNNFNSNFYLSFPRLYR